MAYDPTLTPSFRSMNWKRILACISGCVDQELLLRNEYLATENQILSVASAIVRSSKQPCGGGERAGLFGILSGWVQAGATAMAWLSFQGSQRPGFSMTAEAWCWRALE